MSNNKLKDIEFIEKKLLKIRDIINLEDAYRVSDEIVSNIDDELLESHVKSMLEVRGYESDEVNDVCKIIKQIQNN